MAFISAIPPRDDGRAREHSVSRVRRDGVVLAGEECLFPVEPLGGEDLAVDRHLVAAAQHHDVVLHDVGHAHRDALAVAEHDRVVLVEEGDAVQCALGRVLLDEADDDVGHRREAARGVPRLDARQAAGGEARGRGVYTMNPRGGPGRHIRPRGGPSSILTSPRNTTSPTAQGS
ncbi:hypothetical protein ACUXOG_001067 [Micrococcus aloeverae]